MSLCAFGTARAAGPQGIQAGWVIDDAGNVLLTDAVADRLAATGAGWARLNFRLGPYTSDTPAYYATYDAIVDRLRARGLQIVGLMSNESWPGPQTEWCANNWENTGGDGYNDYIDQFGYAFAREAAHWQGKIRYWEIWNEPNCYSDNPAPGVYTGCSYIYPSNFAALLTHCHSQAHYYNQLDVVIISGGLFGHDIGGYGTGQAGADYLDATYDTGINATGKFAWAKNTYGSYPLDAVGQHVYIDQGSGVSPWFATYLDWIHGVLQSYEGAGTTKRTWITELGWPTNAVSESQQASNLTSAYGMLKSKGYVASGIWFQLDDNPPASLYFGLHRDDLTAKPALASMKKQASYQGKTSTGALIWNIKGYFDGKGGMAVNGSPYDNGGGPWAHTWDYGYVQDFDGGSIGRCAIFDTGHRVARGFWTVYLQGGNHTALRFPVSEEYKVGVGTRQDFQAGYMTWSPLGGIKVHYTLD